jgi:hypothetical protein
VEVHLTVVTPKRKIEPAILTAVTPKSEEESERWSVTVSNRVRSVRVYVDPLPERELSFRPISLKDEMLAAYSSPELLTVYRDLHSNAVIGKAGPDFTALEQGEAYAKIVLNPSETSVKHRVKGYLKLPPRTTGIQTPAKFTGGIIRTLRTDWSGAGDLFAQAEADPDLPTSLRIDSKLLRAFCLEQENKSGIDLVKGVVCTPISHHS